MQVSKSTQPAAGDRLVAREELHTFGMGGAHGGRGYAESMLFY